jgi:kynurenine formamidase
MWRYDEVFPAFEAVPVTSTAEHGFQVYRVALGTHMGTHTDAPGHLFPGGATMDDVPLGSYIGPGALLDVTAAPPPEPCGPETSR